VQSCTCGIHPAETRQPVQVRITIRHTEHTEHAWSRPSTTTGYIELTTDPAMTLPATRSVVEPALEQEACQAC